MTDKPIIFSAPMVRALLDGRKHQTRRVLKPQPEWEEEGRTPSGFSVSAGWSWRGLTAWRDATAFAREAAACAPYATGDRLYVREAWRTPTSCNGNAADLARDCAEAGYSRTWAPIQFEADGARANWEWADFVPGRYRHARFMPRWASRLTLTVTEVRVQRLQEISEEDARAEGIMEVGPGLFDYHDHAEIRFKNACGAFWDLWESLHGPDAWAANPWVCALTFTVERRNIDAERNAA